MLASLPSHGWTTCPERVDDFIGPRNQVGRYEMHENAFVHRSMVLSLRPGNCNTGARHWQANRRPSLEKRGLAVHPSRSPLLLQHLHSSSLPHRRRICCSIHGMGVPAALRPCSLPGIGLASVPMACHFLSQAQRPERPTSWAPAIPCANGLNLLQCNCAAEAPPPYQPPSWHRGAMLPPGPDLPTAIKAEP